MSTARQDAKNEKLLRELLRRPDNKRCPNCDSLGPQYALPQFHIFVCTVCSGVHRQFGHRVKGVSMSTFKPEEIKGLQEGGNGHFVAQYLAKWTQSQLPKPTDRNADRIREWIQAVYEGKRFFDADKQYVMPSSPSASKQSEGKEVPVRQLSDVLGAGTKLMVTRTDSVDKPLAQTSVVAASAPQNSGHIVNLLDVSSPKAPAAADAAGAPAATAPTEPWDAFGAGAPAAAVASGPAAGDGWAAFGESTAPAAPGAAAAAGAATAQPSAAQQAPSGGNWEAFGEPAAPAAAAAPGVLPPASPSPVKPAAVPVVQQQQSPMPAQPVKKEERREVPLDIFFPEFEQIRATGLLPNGQPAPIPVRPPHAYGGYGGMAPPQAYGGLPAQQPYLALGVGMPHAGYGGYAPQPPAGMYQAGAGAPRPSLAIPAAPLYPGSVAPSPAGVPPSPLGYGGAPPPYSPQGVISPAGSAGRYTQANGSAYSHADPAAALRSSTSSDLGSSGAPQQQQQPVADPFSSLAPGFKAALPAYIGSNGAAPAPYSSTPAPYSPAAAPVPAAAAGSPFGSSTLYGGPPSLAAMPYDLSAPAAPKPKASGNPFA